MWHFLSIKKTPGENDKEATAGAASGPTAPAIKFKNVTAEAGISFTRESGARGEKLLPETMGSGCAFFDFDNDGDQDVLFLNSGYWPWSNTGKRATHALYANDGTGKVTDVTAGSGLDFSSYGM